MKILIIAATQSELEPIQQKLGKGKAPFEITYLATGVGMIATTFELTSVLTKTHFDLAINIGIAGAFDRSIELGEVVEVVKDQFAEELVEDGDDLKSYHQIGLRDEDEAPFVKGVLNNSYQTVSEFKKANAITVNKVHGNDFSIKRIKERLDPQVESMEGAAFFYTCNRMEVPTLQLRAISNYVEKRNREEWKIGLALNNLAEATASLINKL